MNHYSRILIVLFTLFMMPIANADLREGAAANDVEKGRAMMREGRLEIVRSEMPLTEKEAADFWPKYADYRAEIDAIQDRYADMVAEYVGRYNNADLSDDYADELIDSWFDIKRELLDVQEIYLSDFRKVLPALKVARLFQLENKINAEIDAQLALVVPLIDPS
jgi:hypothetical protein